jgi:putative colanic acid biosysnthesis UDP-glucose lipid carrier transferase
MFEDHSSARKLFLSAPPSVPVVVASIMEPALAAGILVACQQVAGRPLDTQVIAQLLLLVVLMFPGANRFGKAGRWRTLVNIMISWIGVLCTFLLLGYITHTQSVFPREVLIQWAVFTPVVQWLAVLLGSWGIRRAASRPEARRPAVVIGGGRVGQRVAAALIRRREYGHDFLGIFDDRSAERLGGVPSDMPMLGLLDDLPAYMESHGVKDVYLTLPLNPQPRITRLLESLQNSTASLHFVPDLYGVDIIQGRLEDMDGVPVVGLLLTPFTGLNGLLKRASDIVLSLCILTAIAPIMLVVALGVKFSSPGPVIFRQKRTGLDGEIIEVYKFRSMRAMDNGPVVQQATRGDPRITPFGAFIRRTSLDELPQFINVLQGRMSIVGPRPHAVAHNEQYRKLVKSYMARHKVKPGITGWAQVNGFRGETDTVDKMARRVEYDLEYLRNWSLGLDLLIIARTIKLVFRDQTAY